MLKTFIGDDDLYTKERMYQRRLFAKFCNYTPPFEPASLVGWTKDGCRMLSDPMDDLNIMHEAEKILRGHIYLWKVYEDRIEKHSSARERFEAFVETIK